MPASTVGCGRGCGPRGGSTSAAGLSWRGAARAWSAASRPTRRGAWSTRYRSRRSARAVRDQPPAHGGVALGLLGVVTDDEPLGAEPVTGWIPAAPDFLDAQGGGHVR